MNPFAQPGYGSSAGMVNGVPLDNVFPYGIPAGSTVNGLPLAEQVMGVPPSFAAAQAHLPGGFIDPSTGAHVVQAPLERYTTYGAGWSRQGF